MYHDAEPTAAEPMYSHRRKGGQSSCQMTSADGGVALAASSWWRVWRVD